MNKLGQAIITRMAMCPSPKGFEALRVSFTKKVNNERKAGFGKGKKDKEIVSYGSAKKACDMR